MNTFNGKWCLFAWVLKITNVRNLLKSARFVFISVCFVSMFILLLGKTQGFLVFQIWNSRPVLKSTSADNKRNAGRETAATDSREAHFTALFSLSTRKSGLLTPFMNLSVHWRANETRKNSSISNTTKLCPDF